MGDSVQRRSRIKMLALAGAASFVFLSAPAHAQQQTYDIPATSLSAALRDFGQASGKQIIFKDDLVRGKRTLALKGSFTSDDALSRLLAGTGLRAEAAPSGAIMIVSAEGNGSAAGEKVTSSGGNARSTEGQEIVVTGSNIRGSLPVGVSERRIDQTDISRTTFVSADQIVQAIPENIRGSSGAVPDGGFGRAANRGYNSAYGSGVNLRGLGSNATLVLVNGHRIAPSGSGLFTDISTIPVSAIDHIDVLTDGASAIYGSDAIAGVINIILKNQTEGVDSGVRFGTTTEGGLTIYGGNLQLGHQWHGGGLSIAGDLSEQEPIDVRDRSFTSQIPGPTTLFTSSRQAAVSAAGHQEIAEGLEIHADGQYSTTHREYREHYTTPSFLDVALEDRWSLSAGTSYRFIRGWTIGYDFSAGSGHEHGDAYYLQNNVRAALQDYIDETLRFTEHRASMSGALFDLPAGPVKLAFGAEYQTQNLDHSNYFTKLTLYGAHRTVKSEYGELRVPLFSSENNLPFFRALTVSAAVRHDRYSDVGSTTNPKFGVSWFPANSLELRGAYSTSFRAPAMGSELYQTQLGTETVLLYPIYGVGSTTKVPVIILEGARQNIKPETAKNITVGFNYKPPFVPHLTISVNYYNIKYSNRLASAPFSPNALNDPTLASVITKFPDNASLQAAALSYGVPVTDFTFGAFGANAINQAHYIYDLRIGNLAKTKTAGFDVNLNYSFQLGRDHVDALINATYIDHFFTQLAPTAPNLNLVNTVGQPARFRARGQLAWMHDNLELALTGNYVGRYLDTSEPPGIVRHVSAFATFDVAANYDFSSSRIAAFRGLTGTVAVTNILGTNPPFVAVGALSIANTHYDSANASPVGRFIEFRLTKHW